MALDFSSKADPVRSSTTSGTLDFSALADPLGTEQATALKADKASFADAVGRGVDQMQGMSYGFLEATGEATGFDALAEVGREGRERNVAEAAQYGPRQQFTDIEGTGDFLQWAKETAGEQLPIMAPSMAGAAAGAGIGAFGGPAAPVTVPLGAVLGAFVPSFVLGTGETQLAIKEKDPDAKAPGFAFTGGAAIATLDSVLPGKIGGRLVSSFGADVAGEIAKQALTKSVTRRIASETGKGVVLEGVTEALQEAISELAAAQATGQPISADLGHQMIEAGAAGAFMGGTVSGFSEAVSPTKQSVDEATLPEGALPAEDVIGRVQEEVNDTRTGLEDVLSDDRTSEQLATDLEAAKAWEPSKDWQDVPKDVDLPEGLEIESDPETGARRARLLPEQGSKSAPVDLVEAGDATAGAEITEAPSPAQAEAGNYRKRHVKLHGLDIAIETELGQDRHGVAADGTPWSVTMPAPYGYVKRTEGADGDQVDVYLGPTPESQKAFVVDQIDPETGVYDEHKVMLGFPDKDMALTAYQQGFSDGKGASRVGAVSEMTVDEFKAWLATEKTREALSYQEPISAGLTKDQFRQLEQIVRSEKGVINPAQVGRRLEADKMVVRKVLSRLSSSGNALIKPSKKTGNFVRTPNRGPQDILEFLASRGGIQEQRGELSYMDLQRVFLPGYGKIVRKTGLTLDSARELAEEAGYIRPSDVNSTTSLDDLLGAIQQTLAGERVYAESDMAEVAERAAQREAEEAEAQKSQAMSDVRAVAETFGAKVTDEEVERAAILVLTEGNEIDEALVTVLERSALEYEAELADIELQERSDEQEIPFFDSGAEAGPRQAATPEGTVSEEPDLGTTAGSPPPRQQSPENHQLDRTDAGLQAVIPGAERISDRELAERRTEGRKASTKTQRPADEGLFDVAGRGQKDLLDAPEPAPKTKAEQKNVRPVEPKQESPSAPAAKIEDFGEKLHGARKDYAALLREASDTDIESAALSVTWPEPDYQKLLDDGTDPWTVGFFRAARDLVPAKPRAPYKLKRWVETVEQLRDLATGAMDGTLAKSDIEKAVTERDARNVDGFLGAADLYVAIGHTQSLKGVSFSEHAYSIYRGEVHQPPLKLWVVERAPSKSQGNWPKELASDKTREGAIKKFKKYLSEAADKPKQTKPIKLDIYSYLGGPKAKGFWIGKKIGRDRIDLQNFETSKEARIYLSEHRDLLEQKLERIKTVPNERKDENAPRVGGDHRGGADVSVELFADAFGFRGVQFGNYVEGAKRQADLNDSYDALFDLAGVIDVPSEALSLNGELGLAFGARGKGGKRAALAHYETGQVVINLTKNRGAGSLAHEWWHALDNYFSRKGNDRVGFLTEKPVGPKPIGDVRPEVHEAFSNVLDAIRKTDLFKRARQLDKVRTKPYWATVREITARAFEGYVIAKLHDQSVANDYLANIVDYDAWQNAARHGLASADESLETYPYLMVEELPAVRAAFDALFETLEHRKTEKGVELFALQDEGHTLHEDTKPLSEAAFLLRERLEKLGLADKVALEVVEAIDAGGRVSAIGHYTPRLIEIATTAPNQTYILNHEAVHALRDLGLFSPKEWKALETAAKSNSKLMGEVRRAYRHLRLSESQMVEEAVAEMYARYAEKRSAKGIVGRALARIGKFFDALASYLSSRPKGAQEVLEKIEKGEIGARDVELEPITSTDHKGKFAVLPKGKQIITQDEATKGMLDLIGKGQPIDRVMRLPFAIFGGLDREGRWSYGEGLYEGAEKIITEAKFSPNGRFAWLNGPLEAARVGLIDRYGLSEEYVTRERARALDERRVLLEGVEILNTLKEQNVGPEEARVLQAILTGEQVDDADMKKLAEPIRIAIDQLGREAVDLGLLNAESYERNRGSYLHRVYLKHEQDKNSLVRMGENFSKFYRKKLAGDHLKGRGIFLDVGTKALLKADPEFAEAKRGKPEVGERFVVLDKLSGQKELVKDGNTPPEKITDRVYWPADREVPAEYAGWASKGEWEVRELSNGTVTLWRDFTKAERVKMGEILDARYTIAKTYLLMAHDLSTGRFYRDIATNPEWARTDVDGETWIDAADWSRLNTAHSNRVEWVKVPETPIAKTGGTPRWGALAGMYVRQEIWRDLNEIAVMSNPRWWRSLLTQWKLNKTARNPVVHMNNVMSNLYFMDMADIRARDLYAGLKSYIAQDEHFQDAANHGAFGSDMMSQEVRDNVLRPILDELSQDITRPKDGIEGTASFLIRMGGIVWSKARKVDQIMINLYRLEDEVFRMATYMRRLELGDSAEHAADFARQQFLDYDIRAPWVNAARNSVLPFISYTYRAVPVIARAVATRPWKIAKYFALAYGANALAYGLDDDADEERERASLRDEEQGYTWLGVPRMVRMPFRDSNGLPVFLDVRRWIPAGDVFDVNQGQAAIPIPAPVQFGGPMMMAFEFALNKQAFTGDPITNELTDDWWDKSQNVGGWAWRSWMPSAAWVPGSWYWQKIDRSFSGATDSHGRPYDPAYAVASSLGIKLKPQDVEDGISWRAYEYQQVERELRAAAKRFGRQRARNLISDDAFNSEMSRLHSKFETLQTNREVLGRAAAGPARK